MTETTDLTENGSVLYSQEVTEEIVTQMETDLGASSFSGFTTEGPPYGVDALNQITADLVTKGILNIDNRCKVSISGSKISVASGVCVFGDGSKVRLTATKSVNFIKNSTNYVYFVKTNDNRILLYNSNAKINDEDTSDYCVKLAEISSDKVVSDKRTYAKAKYVNSQGANLEGSIEVTLTFPDGDEELAETEEPFSNYTCSVQEVSVGYGGYNYLHAKGELGDGFAVRIADELIHEFYDSINTLAWVQKNGDCLKFTAGTWSKNPGRTETLSITLY